MPEMLSASHIYQWTPKVSPSTVALLAEVNAIVASVDHTNGRALALQLSI